MSLAKILGKPKGIQSFISDSRWVLPTSLIGLEHEYEAVEDTILPKHTFADFWTYHEEGSLRDRGAEYVFSVPLFGIDAYNAIGWLVSYARESKWKCTKRTGIHVHIDVRDLTIPQLAGLCIIYAAIEPILYRWVGDGRETSHFCVPLYKADEALLKTCSIINSAFKDDIDDSQNTLSLSQEFQRYAGFNLQALQKFGSIEFRHLKTTHDLSRIVDWVNIVMSLKATAFKLPQSDGVVVNMIQRMGARELLYYIFPPNLAVQLYTAESEKDLNTIGLPSARDIAVHGCGNVEWVRRDFPKGSHQGFLKWKGANKEISNPKSSSSNPLQEIFEGDNFGTLDPPDRDDIIEEPDEPQNNTPAPLRVPQPLSGVEIARIQRRMEDINRRINLVVPNDMANVRIDNLNVFEPQVTPRIPRR